MLHASPLEILRRCEWVAGQVRSDGLFAEAVPVLSLIGGGTAPAARLQSSAVSLRHATLQPQALLQALRQLDPPVIGRISDDTSCWIFGLSNLNSMPTSYLCCSRSRGPSHHRSDHE